MLLYSVARTYIEGAEYDPALLRLAIPLQISQAIGDSEL
jgi:hypothetical protein